MFIIYILPLCLYDGICNCVLFLLGSVLEELLCDLGECNVGQDILVALSQLANFCSCSFQTGLQQVGKAAGYRLMRAGNAAAWIVYCACSGAYTMILMQGLGLCSCIAAILRLDVKRKA